MLNPYLMISKGNIFKMLNKDLNVQVSDTMEAYYLCCSSLSKLLYSVTVQ